MKYPEAGKVKTRLGSAIGFGKAAELYRLFIADTLTLVRSTKADNKFVAFAPAEKESEFVNEILPSDFAVFAQSSGDLGKRMLQAFRHVHATGNNRVVIIGTDSPTLPVDYIDEAFDSLADHDLVFGPASDGGYYLVGAKAKPPPAIFNGIAWSTESVLQQTLAAAAKAGCRVHLLSEWYDVDNYETLKRALKEVPSGTIAKFVNSDPELSAAL